ncbi:MULTISPECIES: aspartate kinase [unclassified Roseivivax]|uniref:aspartate kinase n=1 Tax=Roseivivax sp. GX 12232 TaxID=2900547 RepID=UPI001E561055|nr:aspartate kinase [Roseivivax sp. GX 12232]MCE0505750.1 aspartate kinase [Roseivivax sp. GX 12232]
MTSIDFKNHTVEKIGGTSMSRIDELLQPLFKVDAPDYGRIFVVSAFGGITNQLLEHKKTGEAGVYAQFAENTEEHGWMGALSKVDRAMREAHDALLDHAADKSDANDFVRERIEGARNCLIDLHRLCSYGHFRLSQHMQVTRELLSGLGEAHSAYVTSLLLRRHGINARFVDLSGWRDEREMTLDERILDGLTDVDVDSEMPIVTGYAQCAEGLMNKFDRGYSEVTFSQIAALTKAREAIIHKEFHLSSADPKLVGEDNVRKLGHTNYDVADQLSNMGMEAIHPTAAKALRQAEVPLRVTNAFEPHDPGTLIDEAEAEKGVAEIVCGVDVFALELFEQDMVGVKGYDAKTLQVLTKHGLRIVSKTSNANTITHYVDAPLSAMRSVENELSEAYPNSDINIRSTAIASVIGRDLRGLHVLERGLAALREGKIDVISAHQTTRTVDAQFVVDREDRDACVKILHDTFMGKGQEAPKLVA